MKILIVVDMQNDFITGVLGSKQAQAIVPNVAKKIEEYGRAGNPVIYTRDQHYSLDYRDTIEGKRLPLHCVYQHTGWEFERSIDELCDAFESEIIEKNYYVNSYELIQALNFYDSEEIESIEVVGLCTDICVLSNVIIAREACKSVPVIVDASCCAGSSPRRHMLALELMHYSFQVDVINYGKPVIVE